MDCFKEIPLLFRAFKESHKLLDLTKSLHGSLTLDTLYWQNINKQVLWLTGLEDNWSTMSDEVRQSKDVKDFVAVLFKLIFNDDTYEVKNFDDLKKEYETALGQLDLERNSAISKHKNVLGSPEEGLFSCFKKEEAKVVLNTSCK